MSLRTATGVFDDLTNGGRALKVLEAAGLIELDPNAAFNPTVDDITSYKVNITIEELKANTIPSVLPDVAAAGVNGNYALDFGLKTDEAIYKEEGAPAVIWRLLTDQVLVPAHCDEVTAEGVVEHVLRRAGLEGLDDLFVDGGGVGVFDVSGARGDQVPASSSITMKNMIAATSSRILFWIIFCPVISLPRRGSCRSLMPAITLPMPTCALV